MRQRNYLLLVIRTEVSWCRETFTKKVCVDPKFYFATNKKNDVLVYGTFLYITAIFIIASLTPKCFTDMTKKNNCSQLILDDMYNVKNETKDKIKVTYFPQWIFLDHFQKHLNAKKKISFLNKST